MVRKVKRVNLTQDMIDDIWLYWNRVSEKNISRSSAINQVADIIGCSHATVYRVINACEHASAGYVVTYDRLKYPNKMMVEYVNKKFAQSKTAESTSDKSDIMVLADAIKQLAAAIEYQNRYVDKFNEVFMKR